jgi:hypothetical protein
MPAALTNYYNLMKPEVGADQDIWGGELNQDMDLLDSLLHNRVVKTLVAPDNIAPNPQRIDTGLVVLAQSGAAAGVGDVEAASVTTAAWVEKRVHDLLNQWFPINTIVLWAGLSTAIPQGWRLCNGLEGTPDFRDRIILSMGNFHPAGEHGGDVHTGLGQHTHEATSILDFGGGEFSVESDYGGIALYDGGSGAFADLPYYTCCYIMKIAFWPSV